MNKALLGLAGLVVAGGVYYVATTGSSAQDTEGFTLPTISKSELTTIMASQTASYEASGFNFTGSAEHFVLKAEDEQKVRAFLFDKFLSMLPKNSTGSLQPLRQQFLSGDENVLTGMELDMKIVGSSSDAQLEVTLKKLPTQIQKALEGSGKEAAWIVAMLDKGAFSYTLSMDKEGQVNGIRVKDINEKIAIDASTNLELKVQGIWAKFLGDINGAFKMQEAVKNITIAVDDNRQNFHLVIDDIKGDMDQKTPFDQVSSSEIGKLSFSMKQGSKLIEILFDKTVFGSTTQDENGFINSDLDMKSKKIDFSMTQGSQDAGQLSLDGLHFALAAKHISKETMVALQSLGMNTNPQTANAKLIEAMAMMIKSGLSFDITALDAKRLAVNAGPINKQVRDFSFTLQAQLKENSLDMNQGSPAQYLPFIKVKARLALNDADLTELISLQPMMGMFTGMKKIEGDLAVFNFVFENAQITINGNPLPF